MIKFVYCVRRNPAMPEAEFHRYWLENHGPLVRSHAKTLRAKRYVQSHIVPHDLNALIRQSRGCAEPYDGITEVWWDKIEDLVAALQTPEGQRINMLLAEDEGRFVDLARSAVFFTEEHTIFDF